MLHVDKKLIWWIHLFQKLKFDSNQKIVIYNDNLQIIRFLISKILKTETKLRHVDIAQCWLRQSVQSDYLSVNYLSIAKMITNELTKILSSQKHREFINQLRLVDVKHLIRTAEYKTFERSLIKQLRDSIKVLFRKELYSHLNTTKAFRLIKIWAQNLSEWWFWNNQKEEEHFSEDVNSMY
jgi:hypothetical protein